MIKDAATYNLVKITLCNLRKAAKSFILLSHLLPVLKRTKMASQFVVALVIIFEKSL